MKGYKYYVQLTCFTYNSYKPNRFSTENIYTIDNIKHYIQIKNIDSCLLSDNYIRNTSPLIWKCHCGDVFNCSWADFYSGKHQCNKCSMEDINAKKSYTMMKISNCGDMTKCKANNINVYKSNYSQNIAFLNSTEEYGYVTYNFIVENTSKWDGRSNGIILYYDSDNNLVMWYLILEKTCAPSGEKIKVNSSYRKTQLDKFGVVRAELYVY